MGLEGLGMTSFIEKWEKEFGSSLKVQQVSKILRAGHGFAMDINTIEMNCKCLLRWYITPDKAQKYQPGKSSLCWRGCNQKGTLSYIQWDCPKIQEYWQQVQQYIGEIVGSEIHNDSWFCLFHNINTTKNNIRVQFCHT